MTDAILKMINNACLRHSTTPFAVYYGSFNWTETYKAKRLLLRGYAWELFSSDESKRIDFIKIQEDLCDLPAGITIEEKTNCSYTYGARVVNEVPITPKDAYDRYTVFQTKTINLIVNSLYLNEFRLNIPVSVSQLSGVRKPRFRF